MQVVIASMASEIEQLLESEEQLQAWAQPIYSEITSSEPLARDSFQSALYQALNSLNSDQSIDINEVISELSTDGEGTVSFEEFTLKLRAALERWPEVKPPRGSEDAEQMAPVEQEAKEEEVSEDVKAMRLRNVGRFEKYVETSGIAKVFQIIFAEVVTKKIEPANVFAYTAMRLRQIGKEIAHLLPPELMPAQVDPESTSLAAV